MKLNIKKLTPYFPGLAEKSHLMVYLLATGKYSFDQLRKISVSELNEIEETLPEELLYLVDTCHECVHDKADDDKAFDNTSGRPYSVSNIKDVLKRSHKIAGLEYQNLSEFVKNVSKKR